jgi:preprotein translocase subunit SecG
MNKVLNILSGIFLALSLVFAFLPLGTDPIGFLPVGIALVFELAALLFFPSKKGKKTVTKVFLAITVALVLVVLVRNIATKDEVSKDITSEQQQEESQKEAVEDLEGLEDLE